MKARCLETFSIDRTLRKIVNYMATDVAEITENCKTVTFGKSQSIADQSPERFVLFSSSFGPRPSSTFAVFWSVSYSTVLVDDHTCGFF